MPGPMDRCEAEGAEAFRVGKSLDGNPYEKGSRKHNWWWRGFVTARGWI